MAKRQIVTFHSYRGGTGKSNLTANIAVCAQDAGLRVAVLDTDLQSPGIHILFNFDQDRIKLTLYDFLRGKCSISQVAYDVSEQIGSHRSAGSCWLIPASLNVQAITRLLDEGYDIDRLSENFENLLTEFDLDYLFIDTHPGLNKESILAATLSDFLVILVRPDKQDYYGTAVLTEVAAKLEIPRIGIIANKVHSRLDGNELRTRWQQVFGCEVLGILPLCEDFAELGSEGLFVRRHPEHSISAEIRAITGRILQF
jgi:MinD-like ATPase involved in chromosome partitioning or flagellar assembly